MLQNKSASLGTQDQQGPVQMEKDITARRSDEPF